MERVVWIIVGAGLFAIGWWGMQIVEKNDALDMRTEGLRAEIRLLEGEVERVKKDRQPRESLPVYQFLQRWAIMLAVFGDGRKEVSQVKLQEQMREDFAETSVIGRARCRHVLTKLVDKLNGDCDGADLGDHFQWAAEEAQKVELYQ